jgi:hypothetical protein
MYNNIGGDVINIRASVQDGTGGVYRFNFSLIRRISDMRPMIPAANMTQVIAAE